MEYTTRDETIVIEALMSYAKGGSQPEFPFDDMKFTMEQAAQTIRQMAKEREAERDEVDRLSRALRQKDEGMGVLFQRLRNAHVDCSDLIS